MSAQSYSILVLVCKPIIFVNQGIFIKDYDQGNVKEYAYVVCGNFSYKCLGKLIKIKTTEYLD